MDPAAFRKEIERRTVRPAYLFSGDEDLLAAEAIERLRCTAGSNAIVRRFSGTEVRAEEILEAQRNGTLLEPIGAIVVRNAERIPAAEAEALHRSLQAGVQGGPPLVLRDTNPDRRKKLFQALSRSGAEVEFRSPTRPQAAAWVEKEARRLGNELEPGVGATLVELLGTSLTRLKTTFEMVATSVGPGATITLAAVAELVPEARAHALYELQDAFGERDGRRAVGLLRRTLEGGESPQAMVGAFFAELRRLLLARRMDPRTPKAEAARALATAPFRAEKLLRRARGFPPGELERSLERLATLDVVLKTGQRDPASSMEEWLLDVCDAGRSGRA